MFKLLYSVAAFILLNVAAVANTVADDAQDTAYSNTGSSDMTFKIKNTGPDNNLVAVVKKVNPETEVDETLGWVNVGNGGTKPVTVPPGARLVIDDRDYTGTQKAPTISNDSNSSGGSYTIT
jgi:hypothetical protein